jgi:hypothetical protein
MGPTWGHLCVGPAIQAKHGPTKQYICGWASPTLIVGPHGGCLNKCRSHPSNICGSHVTMCGSHCGSYGTHFDNRWVPHGAHLNMCGSHPLWHTWVPLYSGSHVGPTRMRVGPTWGYRWTSCQPKSCMARSDGRGFASDVARCGGRVWLRFQYIEITLLQDPRKNWNRVTQLSTSRMPWSSLLLIMRSAEGWTAFTLKSLCNQIND